MLLLVGAYGDDGQLAGQSLTLTDGTRIDRLLLAIDEARLRPGLDCEEEDLEIDINQPLVADLVAGGFFEGPRVFPVMPGAFCEARIRFHAVDVANAAASTPAEMDGFSLLMDGTRADGTPFLVRTDVSEHADLEPIGGAVSFDLPGMDNPLFIAFDVESWFSVLDLDGLTGATIEVSETQNADRLDPFEDAVKDSAKLFRDENGDGQLSASELAPGKELAE